MPDYRDRLRERLAADGLTPSAHRDAIDEIAEHLDDLYRAAERDGKTPSEGDAIVAAELARMGSLAAAVAGRARRRQPIAASAGRLAGIALDLRHAFRSLRRERSFSTIVVLTLAVGIGATTASEGKTLRTRSRRSRPKGSNHTW